MGLEQKDDSIQKEGLHPSTGPAGVPPLKSFLLVQGTVGQKKNPSSIWVWLISVTYWQEFSFRVLLLVLKMQTAPSHPASCTWVGAPFGRNPAPDERDIPASKPMCETGRDTTLWLNPNTSFRKHRRKNHKYKNLSVTDLFQPSQVFKIKSLRGVWGEAPSLSPFQLLILHPSFPQRGFLHAVLNF